MTESSGVPCRHLDHVQLRHDRPCAAAVPAALHVRERLREKLISYRKGKGSQAHRQTGTLGRQARRRARAWVVNELGPPTHVVHALHGQDPGWEEVKPLHEMVNGQQEWACTLATRRPELSLSQRQGTILCRCSKLYQVARPGPKAGQSFKRVAAAVDRYIHPYFQFGSMGGT